MCNNPDTKADKSETKADKSETNLWFVRICYSSEARSNKGITNL